MSKFNDKKWDEAVENRSTHPGSPLASDASRELVAANRLLDALRITNCDAPLSVINRAEAIFEKSSGAITWANRIGFTLGFAGARLSQINEAQWAFEADGTLIRLAAEFGTGGWKILGRADSGCEQFIAADYITHVAEDGSFELQGSGALPVFAEIVQGGHRTRLDLALDVPEP